VLDAPKPPRERVSLSAARLSYAREAVFLVSGESKRQAMADWRAGKPIPARAIAPTAGVDVLAAT
jgi:6-phosphogluconolactonase